MSTSEDKNAESCNRCDRRERSFAIFWNAVSFIIGASAAYLYFAEPLPTHALTGHTASLIAEASSRRSSSEALIQSIRTISSTFAYRECVTKYSNAMSSHNALMDGLIASLYVGEDDVWDTSLKRLQTTADDDYEAFILHTLENINLTQWETATGSDGKTYVVCKYSTTSVANDALKLIAENEKQISSNTLHRASRVERLLSLCKFRPWQEVGGSICGTQYSTTKDEEFRAPTSATQSPDN